MDHRIIHNIYKIQFNQTVKLPNRGKEPNWKMMSYSLEEKKTSFCWDVCLQSPTTRRKNTPR